MAAALLAGSAIAIAAGGQNTTLAQQATAPICPHPSHDRLTIRKGRDVCAATLGSQGRPAASGFLPTACAREEQIYRIDDNGLADRCRKRASNQGEN